jgi:ankyrin repeat protein
MLVGCGESQQSVPPAEAKPVEPVAEASQPKPTTAKAPDISIHEAAKEGNIEAVKQHLAAGANVNAKDTNGWTPLHLAALNGQKETTEILIAEGADVNAGDKITPLHYAAQYGEKEIVELLISKGADVNAENYEGKTPLDRAIEYNQPETADLLRKHGAK